MEGRCALTGAALQAGAIIGGAAPIRDNLRASGTSPRNWRAKRTTAKARRQFALSGPSGVAAAVLRREAGPSISLREVRHSTLAQKSFA